MMSQVTCTFVNIYKQKLSACIKSKTVPFGTWFNSLTWNCTLLTQNFFFFFLVNTFLTHNMCITQLLLGLVSSYRFDREEVDLVVANSEASALHEAIKTKQLDDDHVVWILSTRNIFQLRETFDCYKRSFGNSIDQVLSIRFINHTCLFRKFISCLRNSLRTSLDRTLNVVGMVIWNLS